MEGFFFTFPPDTYSAGQNKCSYQGESMSTTVVLGARDDSGREFSLRAARGMFRNLDTGMDDSSCSFSVMLGGTSGATSASRQGDIHYIRHKQVSMHVRTAMKTYADRAY